MPVIYKKKLKIEIICSSFILIFLSIILAILEAYFPNIVHISDFDTSLTILRVVIQTIGIFLGFIITAFVMKFNQIDIMMQGIAHDMASSSKSEYYYRNLSLTHTQLTMQFRKYINTLEDSTQERQLLRNYMYLSRIRKYYKTWLYYPISYSLISFVLAFLILLFNKTLINVDFVYTVLISLCSFMTLWSTYINVNFVISFFGNPLIDENF